MLYFTLRSMQIVRSGNGVE